MSSETGNATYRHSTAARNGLSDICRPAANKAISNFMATDDAGRTAFVDAINAIYKREVMTFRAGDSA